MCLPASLYFLICKNPKCSSSSPPQGSNATDDCCSKCTHENAAPAPVALVRPQPSATPVPAPAVTTSPTPQVVVSQSTTAFAEKMQLASATSPTKKRKKKKRKLNYRDMIAGVMEQSGPRDAAKEKESIQKVRGAGTFMKIDKI